MAIFVKDRIKQTVSAGGAGAVTLGGAVTGFQALSAGEDAKVMPYLFEDGNAWEVGYGTYTNFTTSFARTLRLASSSGGALTLTTAATFTLAQVGFFGQNAINAAQGSPPRGRLTLLTATAVPTSDLIGITNLYYTPYLGNTIALWDGTGAWQTITFSEVTLPLGTLTSGKPYDVFGFLSAGALALEVLVWTNDTTRATGLTLNDGWLTKTGNQTRLYLGTFYTTATTTTEDSAVKRNLFNMYNRVSRPLFRKEATANWAYTGAVWRQVRANAANQVEVVAGQPTETRLFANALGGPTNNNFDIATAIGFDSTSTVAANCLFQQAIKPTGVSVVSSVASLTELTPIGRHLYTWLELQDDSSTTFYGEDATPFRRPGLAGSILA